jgi:hypothetical protein
MTYNHLAFMAFDLARERSLEADQNRLAHLANLDKPGFVRRVLARLAAALSSGAAGVARRLDEHAIDAA